MKVLTRDEILGANDLRSEIVEVPEWGGQVIVQELTGADRDEYEASVVRTDGNKVSIDSRNMRAKLVAMSCVDNEGNRVFSAKDVGVLGKKSAAALDRVVDVAKTLSRIGEEAVEELGKDSEEAA